MTNQQLAYKILADLEQFNPGNYRDSDEVELYNPSGEVNGKFTLTIAFRELGRWISDPEEEFDEDDDSRIWDDGEYKKYMKKFQNWAKEYSWFKKVELDINQGEKDWAYFEITVPESKPELKPKPKPKPKPVPKGMYVILGSQDNFKGGDIEIKEANYFGDSINELQIRARKFITDNDIGASNMSNNFGQVFDGAKYLGYISFNGKFWADKKPWEWASGDVPAQEFPSGKSKKPKPKYKVGDTLLGLDLPSIKNKILIVQEPAMIDDEQDPIEFFYDVKDELGNEYQVYESEVKDYRDAFPEKERKYTAKTRFNFKNQTKATKELIIALQRAGMFIYFPKPKDEKVCFISDHQNGTQAALSFWDNTEDNTGNWLELMYSGNQKIITIGKRTASQIADEIKRAFKEITGDSPDSEAIFKNGVDAFFAYNNVWGTAIRNGLSLSPAVEGIANTNDPRELRFKYRGKGWELQFDASQMKGMWFKELVMEKHKKTLGVVSYETEKREPRTANSMITELLDAIDYYLDQSGQSEDDKKKDYIFLPNMNQKARELVAWLEAFGFKDHENAGKENAIRMYPSEQSYYESGYDIIIHGNNSPGSEVFLGIYSPSNSRVVQEVISSQDPEFVAQRIWAEFQNFMSGFDYATDGFDYQGTRINNPFFDETGSEISTSPLEYYEGDIDAAPYFNLFTLIPQAEERINTSDKRGFIFTKDEETDKVQKYAKAFLYKNSLWSDSMGITSDWIKVDPFLELYSLVLPQLNQPLFIDGLMPLDRIEEVFDGGQSEDYEEELGRPYEIGDFIYDVFENYKDFLSDQGPGEKEAFEENDALIRSAESELREYWNNQKRPLDCAFDEATINATVEVKAFIQKFSKKILSLPPEISCKLVQGINKLAEYELCGEELNDAPAKPNKSSKPKVSEFIINWSEGYDYEDDKFKTWAEFQQAINKIPVPTDGTYNKTRIEILWEDGNKIEDRIDIGVSEGDYDWNRISIGAYLKNRDGAMYNSTIEKGQRDKLSWDDIEDKSKANPKAIEKESLKEKLARLKANKK